MSELEKPGSEFAEYPNFTIEYRDASHRYWAITDEYRRAVPSVTGVLRVLDKSALLGWAEKIAARVTLEWERNGYLEGVDPERACEFLRERLRVRQLSDVDKTQAGDRGTSIHEALQQWSEYGEIPNPSDFLPDHRGYLQGLFRFLAEYEPVPLEVERIVGSLEHGFAGRLDLIATIDGKRTLVDLKTNRAGRVYAPEHSLQTAAYRMALEECGFEPVDWAIIVAAGEDGGFQVRECCAEAGDFLAVLAASEAVGRVKKAFAAAARALEKRAAEELEEAA